MAAFARRVEAITFAHFDHQVPMPRLNIGRLPPWTRPVNWGLHHLRMTTVEAQTILKEWSVNQTCLPPAAWYARCIRHRSLRPLWSTIVTVVQPGSARFLAGEAMPCSVPVVVVGNITVGVKRDADDSLVD
jgi:hypothetical protein